MNSVSRDLSGEYRCTTIIRSGELLLTVTPILRTSAGSRGWAIATRFCTCTCAMSRLVPSSKVTAMEKRPSALEFDDMYIMFSTPLICCSIGVTTVEATTSALAPGYCPDTLMIGGAISGYCATGRRENDTAPRITNTIETTAAKIGRSMNKCEMRMRAAPVLGWVVRLVFHRRAGRLGGGRDGVVRRLRPHLLADAGAHQAVDDDLVVGRDAGLDHPQVAVEL